MSRKSSATLAGPTKVEAGSEIVAVRSNRVVLENTIGPAEIVISNGKIVDVLPKRNWARPSGEKMLDVGDLVVMPGIIDPHVHICEPRHPTWEGFTSVTKAAAAGGITTIVDMPLYSCPPTTTLSGLDTKLQSAKGQCYIDVAFWGGIIPGNQAELLPMLKAGVPGFQCFLMATGVEDFSHVLLQDLHVAMNELQGTDCVLLFHAEQEPNQWVPVQEDPTEYSTLLDSHPDTMEVEATLTIAELCLQYKIPCHITNLSSARAIPIIKDARQKGAPITVETTHHYLNLTSECIPPGATYYKCHPPIREKSNQEQLWEAVQVGQIDMVVSAHVPWSPDLSDLNSGDFLKAQAGIASLQFGLPLFWTSAKSRGFTLHDIVKLMCKNPAILSKLEDRKGSLSPGMDADMVIWNPEKEFEVNRNIIHHKHKLTPYLGFQLYGEVFATLVHGRLAYLNGKFAPKPQGDLLVTERKMPTRFSSPYY
ncbi:allantoinase, mitochondrial-like isoform X1 [Hemicordylus capensis]|uniref:allantoinase, mitochondrial-like isoform X1 n=1 Tax=Hemicordylus capensis TaxID=884348 RepID=UPI0023039249|nr:allantoinase, mitochondrial-like isoform X1 [Hemicordylus capensis]